MENERANLQGKYMEYLEFLFQYRALDEQDQRVLAPQLTQLKASWQEARKEYKGSITKEVTLSRMPPK